MKNNLAVNQFLICVFEKLEPCFKILQLFTSEDVITGTECIPFPQRQQLPQREQIAPFSMMKMWGCVASS